jgi:hypothetical protein
MTIPRESGCVQRLQRVKSQEIAEMMTGALHSLGTP